VQALKKSIQNRLYASGRIVGEATPSSVLYEFFDYFRSHYTQVNLERFGPDRDGGYVIPSIVSELDYCFSPGVSNSALFELELAERFGIKSFMADASIEGLPQQHEYFSFRKTYIGGTNTDEFIKLSKWVEDSLPALDSHQMMLQMDIEGYEYDVLCAESEEFLSKFSIIVIEFHYLHRLFQLGFFQFFRALMKKLFENFSVCHTHPNNTAPISEYNEIQIPILTEMSFIRNDLIDKCHSKDKVKLPHFLDRDNVDFAAPIVMPEIWWKN
jgi:hypothetical protein